MECMHNEASHSGKKQIVIWHRISCHRMRTVASVVKLSSTRGTKWNSHFTWVQPSASQPAHSKERVVDEKKDGCGDTTSAANGSKVDGHREDDHTEYQQAQ